MGRLTLRLLHGMVAFATLLLAFPQAFYFLSHGPRQRLQLEVGTVTAVRRGRLVQAGPGGQRCSSEQLTPGSTISLTAYAGGQSCGYSIDSEQNGTYARISFLGSMNLRSTDSVFVHDGKSSAAPSLVVMGSGSPEVPVITGNSRFLFLLFVTGTTDADQRYAMAFTVARAFTPGGRTGTRSDDDATSAGSVDDLYLCMGSSTSGREAQQAVGGALGGYFGLTGLAMVVVVVLLYKRHQDRLVQWRARTSKSAAADVFNKPWGHITMKHLKKACRRRDRASWVLNFAVTVACSLVALVFLLTAVGARAWMSVLLSFDPGRRPVRMKCSLSQCCAAGHGCIMDLSAARMGDDGSDAVMYMAFFGRVFFGLAVVCLAFALALTGVSTLHAKVYTFRGAAPHFVTLAFVCNGVAVVFGIALFRRFVDFCDALAATMLGESFAVSVVALFLLVIARVSSGRMVALPMKAPAKKPRVTAPVSSLKVVSTSPAHGAGPRQPIPAGSNPLFARRTSATDTPLVGASNSGFLEALGSIPA